MQDHTLTALFHRPRAIPRALRVSAHLVWTSIYYYSRFTGVETEAQEGQAALSTAGGQDLNPGSPAGEVILGILKIQISFPSLLKILLSSPTDYQVQFQPMRLSLKAHNLPPESLSSCLPHQLLLCSMRKVQSVSMGSKVLLFLPSNR